MRLTTAGVLMQANHKHFQTSMGQGVKGSFAHYQMVQISIFGSDISFRYVLLTVDWEIFAIKIFAAVA